MDVYTISSMLFRLALAPFVFFAVLRSYYLLKNYIIASRFGLPIILIPVSFEDVWWMPLRSLFSWVERLPFGLGSWYVYTEMGWPTIDGNRTSLRLGENFVLCSPSSNQIITCYPPGVDRIFKDHKNWPQPKAQSQLFAIYGQNVSSTHGPDWQRHRKITAAAVNENSMQQVWKESMKQAADLDLASNSSQTLGHVRSTFEALAIHVLALSAFGQDVALTSIPPGHRESLMQCLGFILKNLILTLLFGSLKAPDFLLPRVLRSLKTSVAECKLYMEELVLRHMQLSSPKRSQSQATCLLEAMVRANEAEKLQLQNPCGRHTYLTESELYGNLFVFNVAGYETTASTMTFAFCFLATNSDIQDWVIEEVDAYYTNTSPRDYTTTFPKLVRCQAWLYETLRLAGPAPLLVRSPSTSQDIPITTPSGEATLTVNPGTLVGGHFYGAHLSPRWGPDADTFNPKRFISTSAAGDENLVIPEAAVYVPW
jgi:cytochrome P450